MPGRGDPVLVDERPAAPVRRREPEKARTPDRRLKDKCKVDIFSTFEEKLKMVPLRVPLATTSPEGKWQKKVSAIFLLVTSLLALGPAADATDTKLRF